MSEACSHDCQSCPEQDKAGAACPQDFRAQPNPHSQVGKVIAVVSGKGGVGKSLVTALLAARMSREGYQTAILDADVTGPSIPKAFGLAHKALSNELGLLPVESKGRVKVMSLNLLLEQDTDAVVWRGPLIAGTVKQFWTDVVWGAVEYLFVDMPPGTGDVPLTVFQSLPVDGVIVVASPQELVGMIVEKALRMATMMHIPVLALVENMSYFTCPDCGKPHAVFGKSQLKEIGEKHGITTLCAIPIDPRLAEAVDQGKIETVTSNSLDAIVDRLISEEGK